MAARRRGGFRFFRAPASRHTQGPELRRLEEKHRSLVEATEKWQSMLREMERNGETGDGRYQGYFEAYIEARQLEKRAELELFNLQSGLVE